MTNGRDDELHAHLQGRIPAPGADYWGDIDARLAAAEAGEAPSRELSDEDHRGSRDTDSSVVRPMHMDTPTDPSNPSQPSPSSWLSGKGLLAAAALLVVVGIGIFGITNRTSDDPVVDLATAPSTDAASDEGVASQDTNQDDSVTGGAAEADSADTPVDGPLTALQARLAGQIDVSQGTGDGSAGPFCFTSNDALIYPGSEIVDRRAVVQLEMASDGYVNFFGLQGDIIVISGAGYPDENGIASIEPVALAGATPDLPPYTVTLTDTSLSMAAEGATLDLAPCGQLDDRLDVLYQLIEAPAISGPSADWPPADAVLSSAGLGPIRIGMTVSELSTEIGAEITIETIGESIAGSCGWISTSAISNDVDFLVELTSATDAIIRRVTVTDGRWSTPSGITVGLSEQTVLDTFPGQIESEPHVYVAGNYLNFLPNDATDPNSVQFVVEGDTVAQIHVGDQNWVRAIEGCA